MINNNRRFERMKGWYEANERRVSTLSLSFGFIFDSLTLQRIDALRENLWIVINLLMVATCIVLLNRQENDGIEEPGEARRHFWVLTLMQFGFGALLGTFFIFYFRSGTILSAWPFLLVLIVAIVSNEILQKRYVRMVSQVSFLYLSIFSFAIFLVPVVTKSIGPVIFIISGIVSLLLIGLFMLVLRWFAGVKFLRSKLHLTYSVAGIFLGMNILYFANIIPPVPLSLKDAGVYHSINRMTNGSYALQQEVRGWRDWTRVYELHHHTPGSPVYVYSAIFSPAKLNLNAVHVWQYKDENSGNWTTASRIPLSISGGRDRGFRTYSMKSNITPGLWRVNVVTERGQVVGRVNIRVISADSTPTLVGIVK